MKNIGDICRFSLLITLTIALSCFLGCKEASTTLQHGSGQSATAQDKELQNRNLIDQVVQAAERQENYPDPTYLRGALGRLNSWLADKPISEDFESDDEFQTLAESFKTLSQNARRVNELVNLFVTESQKPTEQDGQELQQKLEIIQKQTNELGIKTCCNALVAYSLFFEDLKKQLESAKEFQFADATETFQTKIREFVKRPLSEYYNFEKFVQGIEDVQRLLAVDGKIFLPQDADFIREVVWFRDIFTWAKGEKQDDLTIVKNLFDWSVRNIVITPLTPGPAGPMAQLPWQTLLLSQGTAMDRAIVFMELLRQHRLDSFIVHPINKEQGEVPLIVGVSLNGETYLFLPELGLPIPGEGTDVLSLNHGLQINSIATLSQVAKNDSLLRKFDLLDAPFALTSKDFENVAAYVPSTPFTVAARMIPIEQEFSGRVNTVISTPYESLKKRISHLDHITEVKRLFEATAPIIEQTLFAFESEILTQIYMLSSTTSGSLEVSDSNSNTDEQIADYTGSDKDELNSPENVSTSKRTQNSSLWIGKNLYFRGQFTNDEGAGRQFLQGRVSDRVLKQEEATIPQRVREYLAQFQEWRASQGSEATQEELQALANEAVVTFQMDITTKRYIKVLTSFYLALLSEAAGNDSAALDRLNDDTLRIRAYTNNQERTYGDEWRYAANYLRAIILERQGNIETAINRFRLEPSKIGYQVRAKWLAELTGIDVHNKDSENLENSQNNQQDKSTSEHQTKSDEAELLETSKELEETLQLPETSDQQEKEQFQESPEMNVQ